MAEILVCCMVVALGIEEWLPILVLTLVGESWSLH